MEDRTRYENSISSSRGPPSLVDIYVISTLWVTQLIVVSIVNSWCKQQWVTALSICCLPGCRLLATDCSSPIHCEHWPALQPVPLSKPHKYANRRPLGSPSPPHSRCASWHRLGRARTAGVCPVVGLLLILPEQAGFLHQWRGYQRRRHQRSRQSLHGMASKLLFGCVYLDALC